MKISKSVIVALILLIVVSALYRIAPNRPSGFAPQYAMAIFAGAIFIKDKKWAFVLPLLSMFISDLLYQVLYLQGLSVTPGFYEGQWQNYILIGGLTAIGFMVRRINLRNVFIASIASPTVYFIASNFLVWVSGGGWSRPKTWSGLMQCYSDGLPFYVNSLYATVFFAAILFGGYYLVRKYTVRNATQPA